MKKIVFTILIIASCFSLFSCSNAEVEETTEEVSVIPQVNEMKSICELATMQCYYHNVAKYFEEDAEGFWLWKKDRKFWIEYSGIVTIGIDTSRVNIEVEEDIVTITLPPAEVFNCKVDESTLIEDAFVVAKDSATVGAEHQTQAFREAQEKMLEAAKNDVALLNSARQRAQSLLEDYINNLGSSVGKIYQIKWIYTDDTKNENTSEVSPDI